MIRPQRVPRLPALTLGNSAGVEVGDPAAHSVIGALISTSCRGTGAQIALLRVGGTPPISPRGPAAQAGLRPGDVIIRFASQPIVSAMALLDAVRSRQPGTRVAVMFTRPGVRHTVTLTQDRRSR